MMRSAAPRLVSRRCAIALALAIAGALSTVALLAQTPRDRQRSAAAPSSIVGTVVSDEATPRPLRHARVSLSGGNLQAPRVSITNADGLFVLDDVPAGQYVLVASKPGWVEMFHGARRAGRTGTPVVVRNGRATHADFRLPPGAVIAGTIASETGEPQQGITVSVVALRFDPLTGLRRTQDVGQSIVPTDDIGGYRIFGLPAGDYLVRARPSRSVDTVPLMRVQSSEEVRRALSDVANAQAFTRPVPGIPPPPTFLGIPAADPAPLLRLADVYYPGTPVLADAAVVTLRAGEERLGVDMDLRQVETARVTGVVQIVEGQPPPRVIMRQTGAGGLMLDETLTVAADASGRFEFTGIAPGSYTLTARAPGRRLVTGAWEDVGATVAGQPVEGLYIRQRPTLTVSGRLVFAGARQPRALPRTIALPLVPAASPAGSAVEAVVQPDGQFVVRGLSAGDLRRVGVAGIRSPVDGWFVRSIVWNGRDLLDAPPSFTVSAEDVVVTLTDRAPSLRGTVAGTWTGTPWVVVFAADRLSWFFNSRRLAGVRLAADGRFTVANLPAGDYLVAVDEDLEPNEWFDPQVLDRLALRATRVTMGEVDATVTLPAPGTVTPR